MPYPPPNPVPRSLLQWDSKLAHLRQFLQKNKGFEIQDVYSCGCARLEKAGAFELFNCMDHALRVAKHTKPDGGLSQEDLDFISLLTEDIMASEPVPDFWWLPNLSRWVSLVRKIQFLRS